MATVSTPASKIDDSVVDGGPRRTDEPGVPHAEGDAGRLQLVERIANSEAFQKSSRLPALLRYLADCTLANDRTGLTEQAIGRAVFGKPKDFHPVEDSSVRVYVRQLRLRLHEYYQAVGHDEQIVIEIPKGGYTLAFHPRHAHSLLSESAVIPVQLPIEPTGSAAYISKRLAGWVPWALFTAALALAAISWYRSDRSVDRGTPQWPINEVFTPQQQTTIVLADGSYVLRLLGDREINLDEYADHRYSEALIPHDATEGELRLFHYLQSSQITSMADARAASAITAMAGNLRGNIVIRSAKEIKGNMLTSGNIIVVGAKTSNPWAELYDRQLNFRLIEEGLRGARYIRNLSPQPGEQPSYSLTGPTGVSGEDYATISLVPGLGARGTVLLLQGLRLEGTEAAINFLSNVDNLNDLAAKLRNSNGGILPRYFEALLHSHSMGGSTASVDCIAVRVVSSSKH